MLYNFDADSIYTRNSDITETAWQGALVLAKNGTGIFCGHLRPLWHRPAELSNSVKKNTQKGPLCCSRLFKFTEVFTNRNPVCDFLLVSNWYPTSRRLEVIADYIFTFGHLVLEPTLRSLGLTYTIRLRLIGKHVVDFLFVLIELSSLAVTSEALRANIE